MVRFMQVSKHYGAQEVLTNVSCDILKGRKIGLIGPNGAGKTTLVRLLVGEEEPSSGKVATMPGARIGYVPQNVETSAGTVDEYLMEEHRHRSAALRREEERLAGSRPEDEEKSLRAYQRARDAFEDAGGEEAPRRVESLLGRLGLADKLGRKIETLSGGERNILSLAKALTRGADLLVLDEPGNHLDYIGLSWLERFLQEFDGAILVVSHNRYLLDRVVDRIFELEGGRLSKYEGNYSAYRLTRLRNLVAQQSDYIANQKRLAQLEALVNRFAQIARNSSDPAWGRRLHSRKTQLARERKQAVAKPIMDTARISLVSSAEETKADIALQIRSYSKSFGDTILFDEAELSIYCGERVALVGPNGSGKTTLLKDVVNLGSWDFPMLRIGPSLTVGYCAQHQEIFDPGRSVLDELLTLGPLSRKDVFAALSRFLFRWDDLDKQVGSLSGGEKNRMQLARAMMMKANFLILDEPTNHMDIPSREVIEESLASFAGTVLVVSHDRYLLDKVATSVVEIRGGKLVAFSGTYSEFWASREHFLSRGDGRLLTRRKRYQEARRPAGRARTTSQSNAERVGQLERRIMGLEAEKREAESAIAAAFADGDHQRGKRLASNLDRVSRRLRELYGEWERIAE
jgi:ATP-binding cassette subfamily F protein 3